MIVLLCLLVCLTPVLGTEDDGKESHYSCSFDSDGDYYYTDFYGHYPESPRAVSSIETKVPQPTFLNQDWSDEDDVIDVKRLPKGYEIFEKSLEGDQFDTLVRRTNDLKDLMAYFGSLEKAFKLINYYLKKTYFKDQYYSAKQVFDKFDPIDWKKVNETLVTTSTPFLMSSFCFS